LWHRIFLLSWLLWKRFVVKTIYVVISYLALCCLVLTLQLSRRFNLLDHLSCNSASCHHCCGWIKEQCMGDYLFIHPPV
jgi:hypothetical protein